nr:hypothetical protein [Candidatus Gracilibacteria bacterium]
MFYLYLGIYTLFIIIIWGFFAVARIHSYKFKSFSHHITIVTRFLFFTLLALTIIGYIVIFSVGDIVSKKIEINVGTNNIIDEESY